MATTVCSNCGTENYHNAKSCKQCHKTRFEPAWVLAKQPINLAEHPESETHRTSRSESRVEPAIETEGGVLRILQSWGDELGTREACRLRGRNAEIGWLFGSKCLIGLDL